MSEIEKLKDMVQKLYEMCDELEELDCYVSRYSEPDCDSTDKKFYIYDALSHISFGSEILRLAYEWLEEQNRK